MGHTILFTHLKIILLQYFQFSVFSNNKLNPNRPYINIEIYYQIHNVVYNYYQSSKVFKQILQHFQKMQLFKCGSLYITSYQKIKASSIL